jgi:hypothetical protein
MCAWKKHWQRFAGRNCLLTGVQKTKRQPKKRWRQEALMGGILRALSMFLLADGQKIFVHCQGFNFESAVY